MRRQPDPQAPGTELTPTLALLMTLGAVLAHLLLSQLLYSGLGASPGASFGIALLIGFGGALAVASPFIPDPPARSLGVCRAPLLAWLAVPLLVPSILLASELDNVLKLLWRMPELVPGEGAGDIALAEWILIELFILPAVGEVFFRGLLQPRLVRSWGKLWGVAGTAAIAGIATALLLVNPWAIALTATNALVLGVLRWSSGSILPGLLLAALFGGASLLAQSAVFGIPGFDDTTAAHTPILWLLGAAGLTAAGIALCVATKLDGPPSRDGGPSSSDSYERQRE